MPAISDWYYHSNDIVDIVIIYYIISACMLKVNNSLNLLRISNCF